MGRWRVLTMLLPAATLNSFTVSIGGCWVCWCVGALMRESYELVVDRAGWLRVEGYSAPTHATRRGRPVGLENFRENFHV